MIILHSSFENRNQSEAAWKGSKDGRRCGGCRRGMREFQCRCGDEMAPQAKNVIPGNADESIWNIMERCTFDESQEREIKAYAESKGLMYISSGRRPSRVLEAWRLKIGSGECNNYPLIDIASFGKPIILSTGMNSMESVARRSRCWRTSALLIVTCTSMYPTPYDKVRLGGLDDMREAFRAQCWA